MTRTLNDLMEFDHVIRVDDDGNVHDDVNNVYAPDVRHDYPHGDDVNVDGEGWSLMDGYSRQDGYSGPIMHSSELIGGKLETDILASPGYYAAVVVYNDEEGDDNVSGWAVAHHEAFDSSRVSVVWSSYGHSFIREFGSESCMRCDALYDLVVDPSDPTRGEYVNVRGDAPRECAGPEAGLVHGFPGERDCSTQYLGGPCDLSEECAHTDHDCNCLRCDIG